MHAFILAGGFATRLWPLTEKRAKPLLPLAGRPLIEHLIDKIPPEIPVTVSTNAAFGEGFRSWIKTLKRPNVELVIEQTRSNDEKLGALGALAQWVEQTGIDDDILLLTGDNYLGFSMDDFLRTYKSPAAILAVHDIRDLERAKRFGTVLLHPDDPSRIHGFEEKPSQPKTTLVSTGCSILPRETLPILRRYAKEKPDDIGGIFEEFLRVGHPVHSFSFEEPWLDIGSFPSYLDAHRLIVGTDVLLHSNAEVTDSECTGSVSIGRGSRVEGSVLHDTVVFEDCVIEDCRLRDCVIDSRCILQGVDVQGKMIREGTVLVMP